jgi:hypothetical protein
MGVADHVLESIGAASRRMLEHYSHIRIDAERQALDALDAARRGAAGNGNGDGPTEAEIDARGGDARRAHVTLTSQCAVERVGVPRI